MSGLFLNIVNMSISASWIVLVVLLLRFLLKKAPKWITVLLWGIVAVRLICPFSFESTMSLMPSAQTISKTPDSPRPHFESGVAIVDNQVNEYLQGSYFEGVTRPEGHFVDITTIFAVVWVLGVIALLIYTFISYLRVKNKIGTAVLLRDNIFQSENVVSPFVLGIIKPKIYLPFNMNEQDMEHVIAHENAHIRRKDHLWKPLGFLILTLHWFNPLMWLGYVLLCRDIELACDEKVVKELNIEQRADYSQALLTCSINRRMIAACPLAFGEVGVKDRVKSVINYKKPAFWIVIVAIIASIVVAVCFLTNPEARINDELSVFLDTQIADHHSNYRYSKDYNYDNFIAVHHKVLDIEKSSNKATVYLWAMYHEYSCENGEIKLETAVHIPTVITAKRIGSHGHYELIEYWEPHDGSLYVDDIKGKFPVHLHEEALDSQKYADEQRTFCENAANEYFREKVEKQTSEQSKLLEQLRQTHAHFFNVPTEGGLTVYVWEMAKGIYECHLANTARESITDQSFAYSVGPATVEEMKAILSTYDVEKKDITIQPVISPWSSYIYEIDEAYTAKIKALFWGEEPTADTYDGSKIPKLTVSYDGATTHAVMGTTTWTYDLGNGTMQSICGDSSHPLQQLDNITAKALKVTRHGESSLVANLIFDVAPDSITVNAWFLAENGNTKPFDAEVDGLTIKLNEAKETCVYEVVANWDSSTKYFGTVRYSFCVMENNN